MNKFLALKDDEKINVQASDVEAAAQAGISLSTYLNTKYADVVEKYNGELDAFDIALLSKGIIVKDNVEFGIQSSSMMTFFTTDENKMLFPEFMIRQLRQISGMPSIINEIVASTRVITGDAAKQVVLDLSGTPAGAKNKQALKKRRIIKEKLKLNITQKKNWKESLI